MNLVIDDAVEVQQATKSQQEQRRQLGLSLMLEARYDADLLQDKFYSRATMSP